MKTLTANLPRPMLNRLAAALVLGVGAALLASGAKAQSLQELYDAARAYDATYLAARASAESAEYRAAQADALARPTLGLGAGVTGQRVDPATGTTITTTVTQAGLTGSYSVYNRANAITIEQAQRGLGQARAGLDLAEQDLIVRVAQAYFDVLAAEDSLGTARTSKAAIAEQLASAKRNFEVGTATITDTREAQARFDLATAQELAADNDLRVKKVALDQIVGRAGVAPKRLAQPVALPALPSDKMDTWVAMGDEHPAVRNARLALEVAQLEVKKARAAEGMTAALSGTVGVQNQHNSLSGAANIAAGAGTAKSASLGLNITLPLYTGGATGNRIKETIKLEEKSRDDLEYARRLVSQNTRSAFLGVQSLRSQVAAYETAEASTKLALEATQLGYKVGVRVNLDVLNAQTQLFSTQSTLAKARYDTLMTGLRLRQAAGSLKPEDVSAINALLAK